MNYKIPLKQKKFRFEKPYKNCFVIINIMVKGGKSYRVN